MSAEMGRTYLYRTAIGQDSHRYAQSPGEAGARPLKLAGVKLAAEADSSADAPCFCLANSDGDVLFHAVCNAVSGLTAKPVLGRRCDELCRAGQTDSRAYLDLALSELGTLELVHCSCSIEAKRPRLEPSLERLRASLAEALGLPLRSVAITATTGEGLSGMGRGEGIQVLCVLTAREAAL